MWIGHVVSCLDVEGLVLNVQVLEEGFGCFRDKYPFLCNNDPDPRSLLTVSGFPYPTEVEYGRLYISPSNSSIPEEHFANLNLSRLFYFGNKPETPNLVKSEEFQSNPDTDNPISEEEFDRWFDCVDQAHT